MLAFACRKNPFSPTKVLPKQVRVYFVFISNQQADSGCRQEFSALL